MSKLFLIFILLTARLGRDLLKMRAHVNVTP
jgi:hypothetical protein